MITWRFGQISIAESTGLAELLAELVGRFGQAISTDSAIILGHNSWLSHEIITSLTQLEGFLYWTLEVYLQDFHWPIKCSFANLRRNVTRWLSDQLEVSGFLGELKRTLSIVFFIPVSDRTTDTVISLILEWNHPNTTIKSDFWTAYYFVSLLFQFMFIYSVTYIF